MKVPSRMYALASKFRNDQDIQAEIFKIASQANTAVKSLKSAISEEGSDVILQKTLLITSSPGDVSIVDIQNALSSATDAISVTRKHVVCLQTDIHNFIEVGRSRKIENEAQVESILARLSTTWSEINNLELLIKTNEDEATYIADEVAELNKKADGIKQSAKKKRKTAEVTGIVGGLLGVAMAPFTGGTSLAVASAVTDHSSRASQNLERNAEKLRNDSLRKRKCVEKLRAQKKELLKQRSILMTRTRNIRSKTERLTEATNVLKQITTFLLPTLTSIDDLLHTFQDIDVAIKDVSLQTKSFELFRQAFSKRTSEIHDSYISKLKEKWDHLEMILLQYETQDLRLHP